MERLLTGSNRTGWQLNVIITIKNNPSYELRKNVFAYIEFCVLFNRVDSDAVGRRISSGRQLAVVKWLLQINCKEED